jgi:hypothetical protein
MNKFIFLYIFEKTAQQKAFCVPNDLSIAQGGGGDRCNEVPGYSRRRPYRSAVTSSDRLFSANVVLFRRTHKSSGREKEGGQDPVRERVNSYVLKYSNQ